MSEYKPPEYERPCDGGCGRILTITTFNAGPELCSECAQCVPALEYRVIPTSLYEFFCWWAKEVLAAGGVWWTNGPTGQQLRRLNPHGMEQLRSLVLVPERSESTCQPQRKEGE